MISGGDSSEIEYSGEALAFGGEANTAVDPAKDRAATAAGSRIYFFIFSFFGIIKVVFIKYHVTSNVVNELS